MDYMNTVEKYTERFKLLEENLNGLSATGLRDVRREALESFKASGVPTIKQELWKYTNIGPLFADNVEPIAGTRPALSEEYLFERYGEVEGHRLVFVDGYFDEGRSEILNEDGGVIITSICTAIKEGKVDVAKYFSSATKPEESLTALNTAFFRDGAYVYAPKNTQIKYPVFLIFMSTSENDKKYISQPHNLVIAEEGSSATVVESHQLLNDEAPAYSNHVTDVYCRQNAAVDYHKLMIGLDNYSHAGSINVWQERDSRFKAHTFNFGGKLIRNNINVELNGEAAEADLRGLFLTHEDNHVDNHILVEHAAPNCFSNQLYKGLLDGKSTGVFNGKVLVKQAAQKTNAFQSNNNILLSDNATINTKPELEIYADDVKCSHGATSGQLDKTALFYLRARGLPKEKAKALLVHAFAGEVIDSIKIEPLRDYLHKELTEVLSLNI